jgi:hypothetical protein
VHCGLQELEAQAASLQARDEALQVSLSAARQARKHNK